MTWKLEGKLLSQRRVAGGGRHKMLNKVCIEIFLKEYFFLLKTMRLFYSLYNRKCKPIYRLNRSLRKHTYLHADVCVRRQHIHVVLTERIDNDSFTPVYQMCSYLEDL